MVGSGRSRISQDEGPNRPGVGGRRTGPTSDFAKFSQNCMKLKLKEFGTRVQNFTHVNPPLVRCTPIRTKVSKIQRSEHISLELAPPPPWKIVDPPLIIKLFKNQSSGTLPTDDDNVDTGNNRQFMMA